MEKSKAIKNLPFFFIGKTTTEQRKQNFRSQKYPLLCDALGREDTRCIWYSRDHFVKLLEEIDHANGDGIMLHFGTYEEGHEFEGQLCLVMNVTRMVNNESGTVRMNVCLEDEPDFTERSQGDRNAFDPNRPIIRRDFNFGSPCPPRCHGDG